MGTIYIGLTDNLTNRVIEHKSKKFDNSFTGKYNLNKLIYYESFNDIAQATKREKQLKKWNRNWKLRLIIGKNPNWNDLSFELGIIF
jgi:putative endonuclease